MEITSAIEKVDSAEGRVDFKIIEGPFAGIVYRLQTDSVSEEGTSIEYSILNIDVYNKIMKSIFEQVIIADFEKRIKTGLDYLEEQQEALKEENE